MPIRKREDARFREGVVADRLAKTVAEERLVALEVLLLRLDVLPLDDGVFPLAREDDRLAVVLRVERLQHAPRGRESRRRRLDVFDDVLDPELLRDQRHLA